VALIQRPPELQRMRQMFETDANQSQLSTPRRLRDTKPALTSGAAMTSVATVKRQIEEVALRGGSHLGDDLARLKLSRSCRRRATFKKRAEAESAEHERRLLGPRSSSRRPGCPTGG
jgi:hypothetical protein